MRQAHIGGDKLFVERQAMYLALDPYTNAGDLALSGQGGHDAKLFPEPRTMRRRIGVHKHLRRTGRQLRLKLGAQLVIHQGEGSNKINRLPV
jgi:hypothetical protein